MPIFTAQTLHREVTSGLETKNRQKLVSNNKIRIVHLVNHLTPNGKEMGIIKLLTHIDKSLFENAIFVLRSIVYLNEDDLNHLDIICLNKKDGNDVLLPFKLAHWFNNYKPDIVHTHSWNTLVEGIFAAKMCRVPIIIHSEHGTFPEFRLHRYLQRLFWKNSDLVISVSDNLKDKLARTIRFDRDRIHVIRNGVEANKFYSSAELRESFRKLFGFSSDDFIVGTVGRLDEVKNHQMLIRSASELRNKGESIHFVLVGDGEKRFELQELVNHLNVQKYVHFLGYQKDVNLMLNGMDVFTLTSFSEGCSNVIQEAMFAGKPVIATNVGGNPELVKSDLNGYLIESNDHNGLAEKIMGLKKYPEVQAKLSRNALSFSAEYFSLKTMIDRYAEIYLKLYREKVLSK